MEIFYAPKFFRLLKSCPKDLQEEVFEKIALFRDTANHPSLKIHKLAGRFKDCHSFSVNYKTRIIFSYLQTKPKEAILLAVGDHDVYK